MGQGAPQAATLGMWQRRQKVEDMLLRGVTSQRQMAAALGVSEPTISFDVKAIMETWAAETPQLQEEKRVTRIRQLESILQEARIAWERSKQPGKEVARIRKPCTKCYGAQPFEGMPPCRQCGGNGYYEEISRRTKEQPGDPAFLAVAIQCEKELAKLEALYVPKEKIVKHQGMFSIGLPVSNGQYAQAPTEALIEVRSKIQHLKQAGAATIEGKFVKREGPREADL